MAKNKQYTKTVVAGIAGNLMEWYDFAIYGYMVPIIGSLFFPSADPVAVILATFSAFAAGYLARPLGGLIFGHIGDRYGRKAVLNISIVTMGLSTFAIGLLPTTLQIGVAGATLLVAFRILQGIDQIRDLIVFFLQTSDHVVERFHHLADFIFTRIGQWGEVSLYHHAGGVGQLS